MERWVEHYSLYYTENHISEDAIENNEILPTMAELDEEPTLDELSKAIEHSTFCKAQGNDGIPAKS